MRRALQNAPVIFAALLLMAGSLTAGCGTEFFDFVSHALGEASDDAGDLSDSLDDLENNLDDADDGDDVDDAFDEFFDSLFDD